MKKSLAILAQSFSLHSGWHNLRHNALSAMALSDFLDLVFIDGLPPRITRNESERIFAGYGRVVMCMVLGPARPGHPASALIRFGSIQEATWIVTNLNRNVPEGLEYPIKARCGMAALMNGGEEGPAAHRQQDAAVQAGWQQVSAGQRISSLLRGPIREALSEMPEDEVLRTSLDEGAVEVLRDLVRRVWGL